MGAVIGRGDAYRITIEGPWEGDDPITEEGLVDLVREDGFEVTASDSVTVEKVEPPVVTYEPGDLVRDKSIPEYTYYVGRGGYLDLYNKGIWHEGSIDFTSEHYEKVN